MNSCLGAPPPLMRSPALSADAPHVAGTDRPSRSEPAYCPAFRRVPGPFWVADRTRPTSSVFRIEDLLPVSRTPGHVSELTTNFSKRPRV